MEMPVPAHRLGTETPQLNIDFSNVDLDSIQLPPGDDFGIISNNGSSPVGVEPDGAALETAQQIRKASGCLQIDALLLGGTNGHNSDADVVQFYARPAFPCFKNPESWTPQVEAAEFDRLPRLLAAALKARKNELPRKDNLVKYMSYDREGSCPDNDNLAQLHMLRKYESLPRSLSFRSVKDRPDLSIQKADRPTLWPDPEICMKSKPLSDSFQIQISQLSGRTSMQWVSPSDLVQELKLNLERRMGIPSSLLRLLFQGKQLEDPLPLSSYSISRNSLVVATLRLRGGAAGQTSSTRPFSYKDAVHSENPKPPEALKSKAFLVDKTEEVPSVELMHEDLASQLQDFAERAIICRFNGLWPRSQDLYAWIHANWTHHCKLFFCSKGYFIVLFDNNKHYEKALAKGPWFMGTSGLFLTPWFPDFDPANAVITKTPVWIRLPNLPAHLWSTRVFRAIGDTLGSFIKRDLWREFNGLYSYARVCVELDLSKGLPEQINLKINDSVWTQTLDYENTAFRCRHCHQSGHLQNTCPSRPTKKNKANVSKPKSKRWAPCSPPPVADSDSSSSKDEDSDEELNEGPPTDGLAPSSDSAIAQKRVHLSSSSDSEKEGSPLEDPNLQVVVAQPPQNGWVEVKKRKGKKLRVEASTLSG